MANLNDGLCVTYIAPTSKNQTIKAYRKRTGEVLFTTDLDITYK